LTIYKLREAIIDMKKSNFLFDGIKDVYLETPCIVGKNGVERVIELELDKKEKAGLLKSADVLRKALEECE
jgi:malate dehydrogenase